MSKLMIVDGHALAYRAHFAMARQNLTNAAGMPTETIHGFFRLLFKLLRERKPEQLLIVFDPPRATFRHEAYEPYKAHRAETAPELKLQFNEIQDIIQELKLPLFIPEKEEADDVIASVAYQLRGGADSTAPSVAKETQGHGQQNPSIEIISSDKDLFSILYPGISMLRSKQGVSEFYEFGEDRVLEEIGVHREQIPDYMAITGDSSDNIPGVKGIGPIGAAKLIREYGSLDGIYEKLDTVKPEGTRKKLEEHKKDAYNSLFLVTLKKDMSLPFLKEGKLSEELIVSYASAKNPNVFTQRGYTTLQKEWEALSGEKQDKSPVQNSSSGHGPILRFARLVKTIPELQLLLKDLQGVKEIAFDTETTSIDSMQAILVGISLAWKSVLPMETIRKRLDEKFYLTANAASEDAIAARPLQSAFISLNFDSVNSPSFDYQNADNAFEMLSLLKPVLENSDIAKIAQNAKYDLKVLERHGIEVQGLAVDTMLLSFLLHAGEKKHNLDDMAMEYLHHKTIAYSDIAGKGQKQLPLVQVELKSLALYACEDAEIAYLLKEIFIESIKNADSLSHEKRSLDISPFSGNKTGNQKLSLQQIYSQIDQPLLFVLKRMEQSGVLLDLSANDQLRETYTKRLQYHEKNIYEMAGRPFNINSTKELGDILFQDLKIASPKKTPGGALSTSADILEDLRNEHPVIDEILKYRSMHKLLSTYINAWPEFVNPETGRVHTNFLQIGAATGRLSSNEPNLQNIPVRGEDGNALRTVFVAAPGYRLLSLDYSQIELRVLAHYSGDEHLLRSYRAGEDIHAQAAYLLFHNRFHAQGMRWKKPEEIPVGQTLFDNGTNLSSIDFDLLEKMKSTKEFSEFRSQAKVLNFSIVYGVTEFGLARNLNISRGEAKQLMEMYFAAFPGIRRYMDSMAREVEETGYAENLIGRRRAINITTKNKMAREGAIRLAINTPIQSTAADIIKIAMIEIDREIQRQKLSSQMLLQIHDELLFEVKQEESDLFIAMAREKMEHAVSLLVPLKTDGGFGKSWADAKG